METFSTIMHNLTDDQREELCTLFNEDEASTTVIVAAILTRLVYLDKKRHPKYDPQTGFNLDYLTFKMTFDHNGIFFPCLATMMVMLSNITTQALTIRKLARGKLKDADIFEHMVRKHMEGVLEEALPGLAENLLIDLGYR